MTRHNDGEREMWVHADSNLYADWAASRKPIRQYVRNNRAKIDASLNVHLAKETH